MLIKLRKKMADNPDVPGVGEADEQESDRGNHGANDRRFSPELDRHSLLCNSLWGFNST